ncbi:MAG TPA: hypothetical protein VMV29_10490 [Ktedonobacterales bacterium]|nr:hypothetical protein [Ktedonobacterales bacterium]
MLDIKFPFKRATGRQVQHDAGRSGVRPTVHRPKVKSIPVDALKRGDIVLFGPDGTPGALLIQVATVSHYHHVALYDGHNNVIQAMPEGVCRSPLTHPHLIGLRPQVAWWRRRVALWWARTKLGDPYDTRSLFLIEMDRFVPGLRLDNPTADRFSCAVFVAEAYRAAGVDLFPGHRWQDLVPKDFALMLPHKHRPHT